MKKKLTMSPNVSQKAALTQKISAKVTKRLNTDMKWAKNNSAAAMARMFKALKKMDEICDRAEKVMNTYYNVADRAESDPAGVTFARPAARKMEAINAASAVAEFNIATDNFVEAMTYLADIRKGMNEIPKETRERVDYLMRFGVPMVLD